jgi:hypothetical protein
MKQRNINQEKETKMHTTKIENVTIIGRSHTHKGKHSCTTPTLVSFQYGFKMFHHTKGTNNGIFLNITNWFWKPEEGFYGLFEIRTMELALIDFFDYTTFDEELTGHVYYLAGY